MNQREPLKKLSLPIIPPKRHLTLTACIQRKGSEKPLTSTKKHSFNKLIFKEMKKITSASASISPRRKKQKHQSYYAKQIEYLLKNRNIGISKEHGRSKEDFNLKPITKMKNYEPIITKYNYGELNILIDNVLECNDIDDPDEIFKIRNYKNKNVLVNKKKNKKPSELYKKILEDREDQSNQIFFENFLELKYLENKLISVFEQSYKKINSLLE